MIFCFKSKINVIANKFLLGGDKFMPELHLNQPGFTYSACGPFTQNKERIEKFVQTGNTYYIYKNDRDKRCFQHDMTYGKFKDLDKRTQSDNVLRSKSLEIASNPKCDGYQRELALTVYKFFDKNLQKVVLKTKLNKINNLQMHFIHKTIITNF